MSRTTAVSAGKPPKSNEFWQMRALGEAEADVQKFQ